RNGEVYTRYYRRQDANSSQADPAYFVPNNGKDPESANPRYRIRGNGERTWTPALDAANFAESVQQSDNITAGANGLTLTDASKPGFAIFKVEGANVITSLKIKAQATGNATLAVSTTNGLQWQPIDKDIKDVQLIEEVNGSYEVLVKVTLNAGASLQSIALDTITALNSKTQPQLKLGKNTVYVGNGEQTGTIMLWPELHGENWKKLAFDSKNLQGDDPLIWKGCLHLEKAGEGYITYKIDAPADITSLTYGARMYIKGVKGSIDFLHSFDGGKTWIKSLSFTDNNAPYDAIRYMTIDDVPAGTKSVLIKYAIATNAGDLFTCSLYSTHMEVNHKLANPIITGTGTDTVLTKPMEVTFNWSERQNNYSTVKRSHTQFIDKLPATYTINVGGDDQPIVDSLTVNLKGARGTAPVKYGYSDGKDVGGEKWVGQWATYGKNIAVGKPYTVSAPSTGQYGSQDPDNKKLTDGAVGSPYSGGTNFQYGLLWKPNTNPEIVVDLGEIQKCAAFRIHTLGYPFWDAMKGENKDKIEVFISNDGKDYKSAGTFNSELHWKNVPVNFMYADDETFQGVNFFLPMEKPVDARFVKYKVTSPRMFGCTEVQVLDGFKFEPFDLKLAMPDPAQNGKRPPNPGISPNAKQWKPEELPVIGKPIVGTDPLAPPDDGKKKKTE
ncbi:MAG: discoidin domain-containing protein, partial [Phycisphaerales bacterium]|nr:discoidin domain-containing protein [Phycisphaerales bacterium]